MTADSERNNQTMPLDELMDYLDALVAAFEQHPDEETREAIFSLLQGLDALHREAFQRLASFLADRRDDRLLAEAAEVDRLLKTVLMLYDVLPEEDVLSDVEAALAQVRPYIESHGGRVELLGVEDGTVHLEMGGACHGCPGASATLQRGIRRALQREFAGFEEIVVHEPEIKGGVEGSNGLIPLRQIDAAPSMIAPPAFRTVGSLEELSSGQMRAVMVDDARLLLANIGGEVYATGDMCPGSMLPLSAGRLEGFTVVCPWHQERFDLRDGRCVDAAGRRDRPRLPVYPVALRGDQIQVAINVSGRPPLAQVQRETG